MNQPYGVCFNRGGVLVDDFKGHSTDVMKDDVKLFQNCDDFGTYHRDVFLAGP